MSDFVSRLIGRPMGPSEIIRSRVPSLYEPPREGRGSLFSPRLSATDPASEDGTSAERDLSPDETQSGAGDNAESTPDKKRFSTPLTSQPATRQGFEARSGGHLLNSASFALESSDDPSRSQNSLGAKPNPLILHLQRRTASSTNSSDTGAWSRIGSAPVTIPDASGELPTDPPLLPPKLALPSAGPAEPRVKGSNEARAAISPATASQPSIATSLGMEGRKSSGVGRETRANLPTTPSRITGAEAAIRVSIGKVEVRAAFPAPPVRRAPATKPKPSVSLNEYLKRRERGQK